MAVRKYLARDFSFFMSDDSGTTWKAISGLNTWGFSTDSNDEDTSTIDSGAWGSSMYTQRNGSMSLEGFYLVDSVTGQRDSGQLACETAATKVGYDAYRLIRVEMTPLTSGVKSTSIGGFYATGQFALGDMGGSSTDVEPWAVDIVFDGKPTGSGVFNIF